MSTFGGYMPEFPDIRGMVLSSMMEAETDDRSRLLPQNIWT